MGDPKIGDSVQHFQFGIGEVINLSKNLIGDVTAIVKFDRHVGIQEVLVWDLEALFFSDEQLG